MGRRRRRGLLPLPAVVPRLGAAVLPAGALAVGVVPGFGDLVARSVNEAGSGGAQPPVHRTAHGVLLGVASTLPAAAPAALAVTRPDRTAAPRWAPPLRRQQSGHVGDYVAWLLVDATALGALALPGGLGG